MPYPTSDRKRVIKIVGVYLLIPVLLVIIGISYGAITNARTERQMREDLKQQGYEVMEVNAHNQTGIIHVSGKDMKVLLREDGGVGYFPYLACPVLADGTISRVNCAALIPSP